MTFHEFIRSVAENIDERITGLTIIDEGERWVVKVVHGSYFAGYIVNKAEVDARLDDIGKTVAETLNDRLFLGV